MRFSCFAIGVLCCLGCASASKPPQSERRFVLSSEQREELHTIRDCVVRELASYGFDEKKRDDADGRYIFHSTPLLLGEGARVTDAIIVRIFPQSDTTRSMILQTTSITFSGNEPPVVVSPNARRAEDAAVAKCASAAETAAATH